MRYGFQSGTKEKAASGGGGVLAGVYIMRIQSNQLGQSSNKSPQWVVKMTVEKCLTEKASPVDSEHTDWITWTQAAEWRAWIFLEACGINPETLTEFDLDKHSDIVVGKLVKVTVEPHSYTGNDGKVRESTTVAARGYAPVTDSTAAAAAQRPATASLPQDAPPAETEASAGEVPF